jgi:hypothetical protein
MTIDICLLAFLFFLAVIGIAALGQCIADYILDHDMRDEDIEK